MDYERQLWQVSERVVVDEAKQDGVIAQETPL
jgi:hypothetical protein